jgi:hypothetical protein
MRNGECCQGINEFNVKVLLHPKSAQIGFSSLVLLMSLNSLQVYSTRRLFKDSAAFTVLSLDSSSFWLKTPR